MIGDRSNMALWMALSIMLVWASPVASAVITQEIMWEEKDDDNHCQGCNWHLLHHQDSLNTYIEAPFDLFDPSQGTLTSVTITGVLNPRVWSYASFSNFSSEGLFLETSGRQTFSDVFLRVGLSSEASASSYLINYDIDSYEFVSCRRSVVGIGRKNVNCNVDMGFFPVYNPDFDTATACCSDLIFFTASGTATQGILASRLTASIETMTSTSADYGWIDSMTAETVSRGNFSINYHYVEFVPELPPSSGTIAEPTILALMSLGIAGIGFQQRKHIKAA